MQERISWSELRESKNFAHTKAKNLFATLEKHREFSGVIFKGRAQHHLMPSENTIESTKIVNSLMKNILEIEREIEELIQYEPTQEGRNDTAYIQNRKKELQSKLQFLNKKLDDINDILKTSISSSQAIDNTQLANVQRIAAREQTPLAPEPLITETNAPAESEKPSVTPPQNANTQPAFEMKADDIFSPEEVDGAEINESAQEKQPPPPPLKTSQAEKESLPTETGFNIDLNDIHDTPEEPNDEIEKLNAILTRPGQQKTETSYSDSDDEVSEIEYEIEYDDRPTEEIISEFESKNPGKGWTIAGVTLSEIGAVAAIVGGAILMATSPFGLAVGGALLLTGIAIGAVAGVLGYNNLFGGDENKSAAQGAEAPQDGLEISENGRGSLLEKNLDKGFSVNVDKGFGSSHPNLLRRELTQQGKHQSIHHREPMKTDPNPAIKAQEQELPQLK